MAETPATPAPAAATPPAQPQTFEIKTQTGQVYKGSTYEEAVSKLVAAQEEATRTIAEQRQKLEAQVQPTVPSAPQPDTFTDARYFELLAQNPMEAQRYLQKFDPEYQRLQKVAEEVEEYKTVNTFKSIATDFPETNEAAQTALLNTAGKLMAETGKPLDYTVLLAAHHICLKNKAYEPVTQNIVTPGQPPQTPPPPPPQSGGTAGAGEQPDPWKMSMADLEAAIKNQKVAQ